MESLANDNGLNRNKSGTVYVVMGISGAGKTSIGRMVAEEISAHFIDADEFHPDENIKAMSTNHPLTDAMRIPWLQVIAEKAENARLNGDVVTACSALRKNYRDILRQGIGRVVFIHLTGEKSLIAQRIADRREHFFAPELLESQVETLEPPQPDEEPIIIDVSGTRQEILESVISRIRAQ